MRQAKLYNKTKEKKVLVQDNGSDIHSWSNDGALLYYSDLNNTVKSVSVASGEIKEICEGYNPVVCGSYIAYKNKTKLIVKNMQTNKQYEYTTGVYSYCFSPTGSELLIEDEMSIFTAIKNIFSNGIVLGHRVIVWDYTSNRKNTIVNACVSGYSLIYDWK